MDPSTVTVERENPEPHVPPRDQFVRQVAEESRSAGEILAEQLESREAQDAARLFVP